MIEFKAWPKTPRLFRDSIITEKIDGTNAGVGILPLSLVEDSSMFALTDEYGVYAQSRNRIITPKDDNAGFAAWVRDNADSLVADLGVGLHFGEWWGRGIQRNYGLEERRFSLFNTHKWEDAEFTTQGLSVVPVLDRCTFNTSYVLDVLDSLRELGSSAAPGFMQPEGVCVFHVASGQVFKALLENDDIPKGARS